MADRGPDLRLAPSVLREFAAYVALLARRSGLLVLLAFDLLGVASTVVFGEWLMPLDVFLILAVVLVLLGGFGVYRDAVGDASTASLARDVHSRDPDVSVRALEALGRSGASGARRRVLNAAQRDHLPEVRDRATVISAESGDLADVGQLAPIVGGRDLELRRRAIAMLARTFDLTPALVGALAAAVATDERASVRNDALAILRGATSRVDLAPAAAAVVSALRDEATFSNAAALAARIGDRDAVPELLEHAELDREAAVDALCSFGPAAIEPLVATVGRSEAARLALRKLPQASAALGRLVSDTSAIRDDRVAAVTIMGDLPRDAIPSLLAALTDADAMVRVTAASALRSHGAPARGGALAVLAGPDPEGRRAAAKALAWRGNDDAVAALRHILERDPVMEVRIDAARSLGDIGGAAAAGALLRTAAAEVDDGYGAARDPMPLLRGSAIAAVGRAGVAEAAEALAPLYLTTSGELAWIRREVAGVLGALPTDVTRDALERGDTDGYTRATKTGDVVALADALETLTAAAERLDRDR